MRRRTLSLVLPALLTLSAVEAGPQVEPPTFGSDAEVVVLDVVATDGQGRSVADLNGHDLEVSEDGTPCRILSFRLVRAVGPPTPAPTPGPVTSPPPTTTPARPSLVVLVFDRLTTETAPLAREGALDLLSQPFPPDTWFAVFKVGYGIRMLAPFTTDTLRLQSAVAAATWGDVDRPGGPQTPALPPATPDPGSAGPGPPTNPFIPDLGLVAPAASAEMDSQARTAYGLDSLYALLGVARALSVVQGRKSVVYFAEAWHLPARTQQVYDEAMSAANRSNVSIHTVDVRGLTPRRPRALTAADSVLPTFSAGYSGGPGLGSRTPTMDAAGNLDEGGGAALKKMEDREELLGAPRLERLAEDTGGLAIQHTNDLGAGLAGVAQELRQYYEVVYAPANPVADGRFRRIGVKTARRGVHLRTRAGYFATPGRSAAVHAYELPLLDALDARPPAHDFALRATILHFAPRGEERECLVVAEVPLSEVHLASDEAKGVYRAHLALLGHVKDEAGRVVARFTHDWPLEGPLPEKERGRLRNAVFRHTVSLAPGRYALEAAVQDRQTGARSVTRAAFEVPSSRDGLALASIVVPRSTDAAAASGNDPLRVGSLSLVPDLGLTLEAGTRPALPVYVSVYPTRGAEPVQLAVQLRRNGEVFAKASPELPPAGADRRLSWFGRIPTGNLPPGSYEIAVTARQGEELAEELAHLEVDPSRRAEAAPEKAPRPPDPELVPVLERAARYVVAYQDTFRNLVAEERYTQKAWGAGTDVLATAAAPVRLADGSLFQTSRADLVFVRLAGDVPWGVFRDVFEANGNRVRDRDERLQHLFREPSPSAMEQAWRILAESARFNIGPRRTVNLPTLALMFLHPRNQSRFEFKKGSRRRFEGFEGLEVEFKEIQRPTLTRDSEGRSVPARGSFWIDTSRGTVLRSEARYRFEPDRAEGFVGTRYRREPRLGMWVPDEMTERYRDFPGSHEPVFRGRAEATARYSNYRQFTVAVEATAKVAPP